MPVVFCFLLKIKKTKKQEYYSFWGIWFSFYPRCEEGKTHRDENQMFAFTTCWNGPKGRASISIFRRRPALVSTAVTQTAGCVLAVFHWGWLEKQMLHLSKPRVAQTLTQLWAQIPGSSPKRWPPKPAHVRGVSFKPALSCISSPESLLSEADLEISVWGESSTHHLHARRSWTTF